MDIAENLKKVRASLPEHVKLVAVSKTKPPEDILQAYEAGQRDFGENKIQEMVEKQVDLPADIRWHMIGHVQRNKVKYMASFVSLIHGVDSEKLLKEIDKRAKQHNRVIPCLLQLHIAKEESKFGFDEDELKQLISGGRLEAFKNVRLEGMMGMATFTDNTEQLRSEFRYLEGIYQQYREHFPHFNTLSMGMSGDYPIAVEEGSTMVRIGSSIFGDRNV